jgi:sarcosine oxidase, subunit beta
MNATYDVIVIGAGSIGVPTAMSLAEKKLKVLVLDGAASPGQGSNKKAIGGIRATHSDFGKIRVSQRSIEIFSAWQETHGDDIGWMSIGYSFPAYSEKDERKLRDLMKVQHEYGLNIRWVDACAYDELVPGISMEGLRGATFSPEDGCASPLLSGNAFYFRSRTLGVEYRFREPVTAMDIRQGRVAAVHTARGIYSAGTVIIAAGNQAREVGAMIGADLPVNPDNHEAAISEPMKRFFGPMVVDMRPGPDSANYYFYQNREGQVVFCITPEPQLWGIDNDSTSAFFPLVAKRMVQLYPRLSSLRVRRSWRGQYPNTPDGFPIVGRSREAENVIYGVGMCGQGFMLGPGMGELLTRLAVGEATDEDTRVLKSFAPDRAFTGTEAFK